MRLCFNVELVEIPLGLQLLSRVKVFLSVDILLQRHDLTRLTNQTSHADELLPHWLTLSPFTAWWVASCNQPGNK